MSAVKAVQGIVGREGVKGLFAGYGSFLLRDLPFDAIEFVSYEQMKRAYGVTLGGKREINAAETAAMGASSFCTKIIPSILFSLCSSVTSRQR